MLISLSFKLQSTDSCTDLVFDFSILTVELVKIFPVRVSTIFIPFNVCSTVVGESYFSYNLQFLVSIRRICFLNFLLRINSIAQKARREGDEIKEMLGDGVRIDHKIMFHHLSYVSFTLSIDTANCYFRN